MSNTEEYKWLNTKWDVRSWTKEQKIRFLEECFRLGYISAVPGWVAREHEATGYMINNIGDLSYWDCDPLVDFNSDLNGTEKRWEDMFPSKIQKDKSINHQDYYGGDNVYEVMKIIEHYDLGFKLGNVLKYVIRAGKKDPSKEIEDLEKAKVYLERHIKYLKSQGLGE